jgi:hypothetical protein
MHGGIQINEHSLITPVTPVTLFPVSLKEFHVIDGVHFRFFGVDEVNPGLSLPTHTRGNNNFI